MWLICVLTFTTLEVVLTKNVMRSVNKGSFANRPLDTTTLANIDDGTSVRELKWPLGVVQYYFDHNSYDFLVAERVRMAMNSIEETSCVIFKPILEPWSESHWIHITNKDKVRECSHDTAVNSSSSVEIIMTIGIDCMQRRDILHMLMHALGFKDEVTHPQRDQYVRIMWNNINPAYRPLFRIQLEDFPSRNTEYDPMSIMHFHDRAFTKNGQATIASLIPGLVINPSRELSPLDKMKLRLMFGHECNRREVGDLLDSCKNALHDEQVKDGKIKKPETVEEHDESGDDNEYDNDLDNDIEEELKNVEELEEKSYDDEANDKKQDNKETVDEKEATSATV